MVTDLMLVCHGPTRATRLGAFPIDEPLEPGGLDRLRKLGTRLRRAKSAWTSAAIRAQQTAEAIGLKPEIDPFLNDWDHGNWAGRTLQQIGDEDPSALTAWLTDPAATPHGGESLNALLGRVAAWLETKRDHSGRVVAVTHASAIRAAIVAVLGSPASTFWRIDVEPFAVVRLRADGRRWMLRAAALHGMEDA